MKNNWVKIVIVFNIFILCGIALFNFIVDPYQFFHKHDKGFFYKNQRYQNLGLINSYLNSSAGYDSIIVGSSLSHNFYPQDAENILSWNKVLKLTANGALGKTQNTIVIKALETGKVKNILWEIFPYAYTFKDQNKIAQSRSMPFDLYENKIIGYIGYLLSLDTSKLSYKFLRGKVRLHEDIENLYSTSHIEHKKAIKFNDKKNIFKLTNNLIRKGNISHIDFNDKDFSSIDNNILEVVQKYPDVQFYFYFTPISRYIYAMTPKNFNRYSAMQKYLVRKSIVYSNVKIFAFDNYDFTADLANYRDVNHYLSNINKIILKEIANKNSLLTNEKLKDYLNKKIKNIKEYKVYSTYHE